MLPLLFFLASFHSSVQKRGTKMENSPLQLFHLNDPRLILFLLVPCERRELQRGLERLMGTVEVNYFSLFSVHVRKILS